MQTISDRIDYFDDQIEILHNIFSTYLIKMRMSSIEGFCTKFLQEAEKESIELQSNLDGIKEEKERLLNSLVEAEWVVFFQSSLIICSSSVVVVPLHCNF